MNDHQRVTSLLDEVRKTERFMHEELPQLDSSLATTFDILVDMYVAAGAPNGMSADAREMQDMTIAWLEEVHDLSTMKELSAEEAARMNAMLEEAKRNGDIATDRNGMDIWTPLGITRWMYANLYVLLSHAEEQERGLKAAEIDALLGNLARAYHAVKSYTENR